MPLISMRHDRDNKLLSDAIHAVCVELSKFQEIMKKSVEDMTDLEKWAVFFQYASGPVHRERVNEVIASKGVYEDIPGFHLGIYGMSSL